MIKLIYFFSVFMIFYVYLGYPMLAWLLSLFKKQPIQKGDYAPDVTILIAAFNEADCIEATIKNKLELEYPEEKLEILVISDGSTDGTDDIVRKYESHRVKLIRQEPRAGKTSALNVAVPVAKGEILFFSDANSLYAVDALKKITANFNDPEVGYVTGKMVYIHSGNTAIGDGCSSYMRYENFLRDIETTMGSVVGVDGGIDAVRKKLYQQMRPDQLPDFVLPLKVIEQGFRVIYESEAVLKESSLKDVGEEYKMRVRVSLRALWALSDMRHLLSLKKYKLFAWQLWSHKVLRYLCFIFLIAAYFTNFFLLADGGIYLIFLAAQTLAYVGAIVSPVAYRKNYKSKLFYLLHYFVLLNLASAHAFLKFVFRKKQVLWTPRKG